MNSFQSAITVLTLAIFITFASIGQAQAVDEDGTIASSANASSTGNGADNCAGCASGAPGQ